MHNIFFSHVGKYMPTLVLKMFYLLRPYGTTDESTALITACHYSWVRTYFNYIAVSQTSVHLSFLGLNGRRIVRCIHSL